MTTPLRAVLWDLDGTLVDSAELHWRSWRDTMAAEGHPITHQQFLDTFGQKNDRILPGWLGADTPIAIESAASAMPRKPSIAVWSRCTA